MLVLAKRSDITAVNIWLKQYLVGTNDPCCEKSQKDGTPLTKVKDVKGNVYSLPAPAPEGSDWVDRGNLFGETIPDALPIVFQAEGKLDDALPIFRVEGATTFKRLVDAYNDKQSDAKLKIGTPLKGNFDALAKFVEWTKEVAKKKSVNVPAAAHSGYDDVYPQRLLRYSNSGGAYRGYDQRGGRYADAEYVLQFSLLSLCPHGLALPWSK